jgi:RNA polymerase sigma-70 factor (TIGR02943 family)
MTSASAPQLSNEEFSNWVKLYTSEMYSWAFHKIGDKNNAEDLVQDTFLAAYNSLEKFKGESNPKTWLLAILNRKIIDFYRANAKKTAHEGGDKVRIEADGLFETNGNWKSFDSADWQANDQALLDTPEFISVFKACMGKLPSNWQLSLKAKYLIQKDAKQICKELEITPSNYWQILHRAKVLLKKCIETNWFNVS